jgi:Fe-S cluster assembly iron-binding protein IscA
MVVRVTEKAAQKLKELFAEPKNTNKNMLRVSFMGYG